ncbi:MAG: cytochrome C oxidase subunit IV family protein [Gemmatimonadota bacterium]|nr:cytochrome C oxidase subunit IV family protein [Gemmatimonadota bacterium]
MAADHIPPHPHSVGAIEAHPDAHVDAHGVTHGVGEHPHHPDWATYKWVALILTLITVGEVWIYYTPFKENRLFVPALLIMSAIKFATVVMFYMHLKYDSKIFRVLFVGPLIIAMIALVSLLFLFGHLALRTG